MAVLDNTAGGWRGEQGLVILGANARWDIAQAEAGGRGGAGRKETLFVPVFVRLRPDEDGSTPLTSLRATLDASGPLFLDTHETEALRTEIARAKKGATSVTAEIRSIVWSRADSLEKGNLWSLWDVLQVGTPVAISAPVTIAETKNVYAERRDAPLAKPLVAVIDDGIGFLNARFRMSPQVTRFRAVWVQAAEMLGGEGGPVQVTSGIVLGTGQINTLLQQGAAEAHAYRALNAAVFAHDVHQSTNARMGHGTHVLDAAAGAAMGSDMAQVPLLAVQLPPAAIGETSGRRLDPHIVQALRWLTGQALLAVSDAGNDGAGVPLFVNISLGSLAGPQDGTGFLEDWLAYEIARFRRLSRNTPIRVVAAYGNAWRARLVARKTLARGEAARLDWRILPDDATPSFVELRVPKRPDGTVPAVRLTLEPPPGGPPPLTLPDWLAPGDAQVFAGPAGNMVAVYGVEEERFHTMVVAVAATQRHGAGTVAPAGAWRLTLANKGAARVRLSVRVQRDDTPAGYRRRGRQSWLDHPRGWEWDPETQDWTAPAPDCPVTRQDTEVSFSGLSDPGFYLAAASRGRVGAPGVSVPARYSAQGPNAPTVAAPADAGAMLLGQRGAGVVTGTTGRLSGSSVAAPQVVRRLLGLTLTDAPAGAAGPDPAEIRAVLGLPPARPLPLAPDSRAGYGMLGS